MPGPMATALALVSRAGREAAVPLANSPSAAGRPHVLTQGANPAD